MTTVGKINKIQSKHLKMLCTMIKGNFSQKWKIGSTFESELSHVPC